MTNPLIAEHDRRDSLVHQALLYRGPAEFKHRTARFIEEGLDAGEPVLVAVPTGNLELVRSAVSAAADRIRLQDMTAVGRNPNRILALIKEWADLHRRRVRFVGEPIWPGRSEAEAVEGARHEALINIAFAHTAMTVLCPYDAGQLDRGTLACAERTHPAIACARGGLRASARYRDPMDVLVDGEWPLSRPVGPVAELAFTDDLGRLRRFAARSDAAAGLRPDRLADLVFALNEAAGNVLKHGAGHGSVTIWREGTSVIGEVSCPGRVTDIFAGRWRPAPDALSGRGLWLVNQICDLVQIRTGQTGTSIRVHLHTASTV